MVPDARSEGILRGSSPEFFLESSKELDKFQNMGAGLPSGGGAGTDPQIGLASIAFQEKGDPGFPVCWVRNQSETMPMKFDLV